MITVNGENYFSPREIATENMIVNSKGKGDYMFVIRLINKGKIEAKVFNKESKIPYYMVSDKEIKRYNSQLLS